MKDRDSFELRFMYVLFGVNECVYMPAQAEWDCGRAL